MKPVRTMSELCQLAQADERYQRLCIVALNNLGCDHLAGRGPKWKKDAKWKAYFHGLNQYIDSLVAEYGESEAAAVESVLAEVNNVRDCIDQAQLDWGK